MSDRVIVGISGKWQTKQELISSLVKTYGKEYVYAGNVLFEASTKQMCQIDLSHQDDNLECSFQTVLKLETANAASEEISLDRQTVYLSFNHPGYETCLKAARFAKVLLDIGGSSVRVASTGITHHKTTWLEKYNSSDVFDIYSLFVTLIEEENYFSSWGMNNFGKADTSVDATEDMSLAIYVINVFNYYRLTKFPILQDGQTFQPDLECPAYEIKWTPYAENVCGRWHLAK